MISLTGLLQQYPQYSIIAISVIITFLMTLVTKFLTDQKRMKELKEIQKSCQQKLKEANNSGEKEKIQKEMMACSIEFAKHSFKPVLITFVPVILLLYWIREIYSGVLESWIWWYIGASIISSIIFRKLLKVV